MSHQPLDLLVRTRLKGETSNVTKRRGSFPQDRPPAGPYAESALIHLKCMR